MIFLVFAVLLALGVFVGWKMWADAMDGSGRLIPLVLAVGYTWWCGYMVWDSIRIMRRVRARERSARAVNR
jgi:hypothetical protein